MIFIKRAIHKVFKLLGFELHRRTNTRNPYRNEQMYAGLQRFKKLQLPIATIIDVGAAAGTWTHSAREIWPDASFVLFEPLEERRKALEALVNTYSNFHYVPKAAGKQKGQVEFVISEDLDGSGISSDIYKDVKRRAVEVASIPSEIERLGVKGPYIIKLDTHGFETPILDGCAPILSEVSLFIIECYGFQIAKDSLLFWEMCRYMESLGFRLFDLVDVMHRPFDGAFWQCDAFFIRKENTLFHYNQYK